jgi:hypothetical protein
MRNSRWRQRLGALKRATAKTIDLEVSRAYGRAKDAGEKPPNLVEVVAPVRASLAVLGYFTSVDQIQKVAKREKYARLRFPVGSPTVEKRRK